MINFLATAFKADLANLAHLIEVPPEGTRCAMTGEPLQGEVIYDNSG